MRRVELSNLLISSFPAKKGQAGYRRKNAENMLEDMEVERLFIIKKDSRFDHRGYLRRVNRTCLFAVFLFCRVCEITPEKL